MSCYKGVSSLVGPAKRKNLVSREEVSKMDRREVFKHDQAGASKN